jgi:trigger factor
VKLTVERLPESQVRLDIAAEEAEFAQAVEKAAKKVARDITLPGFRKGKVPRHMIERMYGREVFLEEAGRLMMDDLYRQALEQEDLTPVGNPEVEITAMDPVAFTVEVSCRSSCWSASWSAGWRRSPAPCTARSSSSSSPTSRTRFPRPPRGRSLE